jgi:hypothetical protein
MAHLVRLQRAVVAAALVAALGAPAPAASSSALRPLWLKRSSYGESFTFIADLDDGTYVQLSLSFTNLGPGPTKGLCRALVVRAAGGAWKASTRVGRDSYSWRDAEEERLAIGPCAAWIDGAATGVEVPLEGGSVRLLFAARPGRRAGREAVVTAGAERYDTEVLLHHVPVSATIALPGDAERHLAGGGYLDHTRSTISPVSLAARWVRFRALRGERALLVLGRQSHDGRFTPLWACEGPACRDYAGFKVDRDGAGRAPAFRIQVAGAEDPLDIRSGRLLYRDAPVEDLGVLGKLVMPFTGNPVTYVYRARASEDRGAPVEGILAVEMASE